MGNGSLVYRAELWQQFWARSTAYLRYVRVKIFDWGSFAVLLAQIKGAAKGAPGQLFMVVILHIGWIDPLSAQQFDMVSPYLGPDSPNAIFSRSTDFKAGCLPCRNSSSWTWVQEHAFSGQGCNPECFADFLSATFGCNSFSLQPLTSQEAIRLISEWVHGAEVVLESGGKQKSASITDLALSLRDYDGAWRLSIDAKWGPTKLNDLIQMKLQDKQRTFALLIGRRRYSFNFPNFDFEEPLRRVLTKCKD